MKLSQRLVLTPGDRTRLGERLDFAEPKREEDPLVSFLRRGKEAGQDGEKERDPRSYLTPERQQSLLKVLNG